MFMRHKPQPVNNTAAAKAIHTAITHIEVSTCPSRVARWVLATLNVANRQKNIPMAKKARSKSCPGMFSTPTPAQTMAKINDKRTCIRHAVVSR